MACVKSGRFGQNEPVSQSVLGGLKFSLKQLYFTLTAALLIHYAIAQYGAFADTILVLFCFAFILLLLQTNSLKLSLLRLRFAAAATLLGVLSYKLVFALLVKLKIAYILYSNQVVSGQNFLNHLTLGVKLAFKSLTNYKFVYMPNLITIAFFGVLLLLVGLILLSKRTISVKLALIFALFIALVTTKSHIIFSDVLQYGVRHDFFGLLLWRVGVFGLALTLSFELQRLKTTLLNALFLTASGLLLVFLVADLRWQLVQKLQFTTIMATNNRIIARLEAQGFDYNKQYYVIFIKDNSVFLHTPYRYNNRHSLSVLPNAASTPRAASLLDSVDYSAGNCAVGLNLLLPKPNVVNRYFDCFEPNSDTYQDALKKLDNAGILAKLQPFPKPNSVVLFENLIVLAESQNAINNAKKFVKTLK